MLYSLVSMHPEYILGCLSLEIYWPIVHFANSVWHEKCHEVPYKFLISSWRNNHFRFLFSKQSLPSCWTLHGWDRWLQMWMPNWLHWTWHVQMWIYCAASPCHNNGTCVNEADGYRCECPSGHKGPDCADVDQCVPNPCLNGGTCEDALGS